MDPDYFRWKTQQCLLIHKYDSDGKRLTAFSACPSGLDLRRQGSIAPGPDFTILHREVNLGKIWISGGRIYHLLPASHTIRTFNLNGREISETALERVSYGAKTPADPTVSATDYVRRAVVLPEGKWLVEWNHVEEGGGVRRSARSICLHDSAGKKLAEPTTPEPRTAVVFADENGNLYTVRETDFSGRTFDLIRGAVQIQ